MLDHPMGSGQSSADDFVVCVAPDSQPDWIAPDWLREREAIGGSPTAYLCLGLVCSLPAREPAELELPPPRSAR